MATPKPKAESGKPQRWLWTTLKWTLCVLVVVFVARRALELWRDDAMQQVQLGPMSLVWLGLSGCVYVAGWLPSVWFWRRSMGLLGGDVRFADTARAYYCGHLGKYVPGKATVLVIRASMMKARGLPAAPAAVTAALETIVMMGVGLAVAAALLPTMFTEADTHNWPAWGRWLVSISVLPAILVVVASIILLPLLSRLLTRIAVRMASQKVADDDRSASIGTKFLAKGMIALAAGWALHGLSLGLTLQAVSSTPFDWGQWPVWVGAASLATSVGFVMIFAPGGIGVREGLLFEVLRIQPGVGAQQAVAAAILLRLVWLMAEIIAAVVLYYTLRPRSVPSPLQEPSR